MLVEQFRKALFEEILDEIRDQLKRKIAAEKQRWIWGFQWCGAQALKKQLREFEESINSYRAQFHNSENVSSLAKTLNVYFSVDAESTEPSPLIHSYLSAVSELNSVWAVRRVGAPASSDSCDATSRLVSRCQMLCDMTESVESKTLYKNIRTQIAALYSCVLNDAMNDEEICARVPWMLRTPSERQTVREILAIANKDSVTNDDKLKAINCLDRLSHFKKSSSDKSSVDKMKMLFRQASYFPLQQSTDVVKPSEPVVTSNVAKAGIARLPGSDFKFFQKVTELKTMLACAEQACEYVFEIITQFQPDFEWKGHAKNDMIESFLSELSLYGNPESQDRAKYMVAINVLWWYVERCNQCKPLSLRSKVCHLEINNLRLGLMNSLAPQLPKDYKAQIDSRLNANDVGIIKLQEIIEQLFPDGIRSHLTLPIIEYRR